MSMSRDLAIEVEIVPMLLDHSSCVGYKTAMLGALAFRGWDGAVLGHITHALTKKKTREKN
jgi:hypothetical protein